MFALLSRRKEGKDVQFYTTDLMSLFDSSLGLHGTSQHNQQQTHTWLTQCMRLVPVLVHLICPQDSSSLVRLVSSTAHVRSAALYCQGRRGQSLHHTLCTTDPGKCMCCLNVECAHCMVRELCMCIHCLSTCARSKQLVRPHVPHPYAQHHCSSHERADETLQLPQFSVVSSYD